MEVDFWPNRLSFFILYLWLCLHFFENEDVRPRKLSIGGGDRLYQPTVRRFCAIISSILYHSGDSTRDKCGAQQNFHADSIRVSRYFILGANNLHDFSALLNDYQAREARIRLLASATISQGNQTEPDNNQSKTDISYIFDDKGSERASMYNPYEMEDEESFCLGKNDNWLR